MALSWVCAHVCKYCGPGGLLTGICGAEVVREGFSEKQVLHICCKGALQLLLPSLCSEPFSVALGMVQVVGR